MGIEIEGLDNLNKSINEAVDRLVDASNKAKGEAIEILSQEIREDAPVDTGFLRDSVNSQEDGIHVGAEYADEVENNSPFIRPVLNRSKGKYQELFIKEFNNG